MKKIFICLFTGALFAIVACGSRDSYDGLSNNSGEKYNEIAMAYEDMEVPASAQANPMQATPTERKIIKEGEIVFETTDVEKTMILVQQKTKDSQGYISQDQVYSYNHKTEYRVNIRVPADKFDELLEGILAGAEKVDSKNVSALDVTEEFVDIEARIATKSALESRYKELLGKANKVEEMLAIEKELGNLRTEIEVIEGRLRYLKDKVSLSTLTVVFYQKTTTAFGFSTKFTQAIGNGWDNMMWFVIGMVNIWPFLLLAVAILVVVWRYKGRKRKEKVA